MVINHLTLLSLLHCFGVLLLSHFISAALPNQSALHHMHLQWMVPKYYSFLLDGVNHPLNWPRIFQLMRQ